MKKEKCLRTNEKKKINIENKRKYKILQRKENKLFEERKKNEIAHIDTTTYAECGINLNTPIDEAMKRNETERMKNKGNIHAY